MAIIADHSPVHAAPRVSHVAVSWPRVWRAVRWPVVLAVLLLAVAVVPQLWGWQFHWLSTGHGSWSMAAEGGVMPLSMYYIAQSDRYSIGDIVSFEYTGSLDQSQNGPSIKQVVAVTGDVVRVAGLNGQNSVPPCDVLLQDIRGRIVARWSLVPVAYWRWLSMDWQLTTDDIATREKRIFSLQTVTNACTSSGRLSNWVAISFPPGAIKHVAGERAVVGAGNRVVVYSAPGHEAYASPVGTAFGGVDGQMLVVSRRGRSEVIRVDLVTLNTTETTAPVAGRFVVLTPVPGEGKLLPTMFCPQALPSRFVARIGERSYRGSALPSTNPLGSIVVVVPALPPGGAVKVEVIEVPDKGTEIAATPTN